MFAWDGHAAPTEDLIRLRKTKSVAVIFTERIGPMAQRSFFLVAILALGLVLGRSPVYAASLPADTTTIAVRLYNQSPVETATLTVRDGPMQLVLPRGGTSPLHLAPGDSVRIGVRQNDVYVQGEKTLYATELTLRSATEEATWTLSPASRSPRTYTGQIRLTVAPERPESLQLVNDVPLSDYVAGVVTSEYGFDDTAGTRAMAVAARTYGLFAANEGQPFDHTDGTISQVYRGVDSIPPRARRAAAATEGEVLTYNGRLIQAVHFSSSGGHTANNEDVWRADTARPYLRGRPDPYDDSSPHHRWTTTLDRPTVLQILSRAEGASVTGFLLEDETDHGRVTSVTLLRSDDTRREMNANAFRRVLNQNLDGARLKSTWFDARREGDQYVFDGRGFGHGVGLSQWGAHAMAQSGRSYRDILRFYYEGVEIQSLDGVPRNPETERPIAQSSPDAPPDTTGRRIGW